MLDADGRAARTLALAASIVGVLAPSRSGTIDFVTVARADPQVRPSDPTALSVSGDGRYVAFISNARLTAADQNALSDIYVLDRQTGTVSLETPPSGVHAGSASAPHLSYTGRYLLYEALDDIPGVTARLVILRDRLSGDTRSLLPGAQPRETSSRGARISASGDRVVFASTATTLVDRPDANAAAEDIYLFDVGARRYERVSVDSDGRQRAAGASYGAAISADARYVAFSSSAVLDEPPVTPERKNPFINVYLRDTVRGTTTRVSVAAGKDMPNGSSYEAAISADGRYVAFVSEATNLLKERDTNRAPDVYVRDTARNVTELISRRASGGAANGPSSHPSISADGRIVVFQSDASDLVCVSRCAAEERDINLVTDIFSRDRESGAIRRISRGRAPWMEPSVGPGIDGTGTVVAFSSRHPRHAADDTDDFDLFVWSADRNIRRRQASKH
jgi:TolB protein